MAGASVPAVGTDLVNPVVRQGMQLLYEYAQRAGLHPRITSTDRSYMQQAQLYRAYLNGKSRWPAAPPGHSLHERGLAFDMTADDLPALGRIWNSWGGYWGGAFGDDVHFEVRPR